MTWHIETDCISLIAACLLFAYKSRVHPDEKEKLRSRSFSMCLGVCVLCTVIDILASLIMDFPLSRFLYHTLMTMYFVFIVQVILSWFFFSVSILYEDSHKFARTISLMATVPYIVYAIIAISNPWTELIYSLDRDMRYARGPLFFLMIGVFSCYTVVLFLLTVFRRRHIAKRYSSNVLIAIPIVLAASIAIQLSHTGWLIIMPAYTLCLLMAFFFLQSEEIHEQKRLVEHLSIEATTDKLTGVLNRVGIERQISEHIKSGTDEHCLTIFIDVDDLKIINDSMGHEGGDKALLAISRRLSDYFDEPDIIARYGGDEFVAFTFGDFSKEKVDEILRGLNLRLTSVPIDKKGKNTISASIGAAWGRAIEVEELLHQADAALYTVKRNGKGFYALYNPETM